MSKRPALFIQLIAGLGVEGDVHAGATVKHRSRITRDATAPNLRQVHFIHEELLDELRAAGFDLAPGRMGENITTRGIDLLGLSEGSVLRIGNEAIVEITGLRNPCSQLNRIQPGLMDAVLSRDSSGDLVRKAGIMGIVRASGPVQPDDTIAVLSTPSPVRPLKPV